MLETVTVQGGFTKRGEPETIRRLDLRAGEILAVVGPTGSGKSQLVSDIEQWADGESPSRRNILIDGVPAAEYASQQSLRRLVAEVSQNMNFVIDMPVEDFLCLHAHSRGIEDPEAAAEKVMTYCNELAGEPIHPEDKLTVLSGGQSRALMVADVALISDAPVVLIDEIENAGIDRLKALRRLAGAGKVVVVVTHDPMLALVADRRVVMKDGGMVRLCTTTPQEKLLLEHLLDINSGLSALREQLRQGGEVKQWTTKEGIG